MILFTGNSYQLLGKNVQRYKSNDHKKTTEFQIFTVTRQEGKKITGTTTIKLL